MYERDSIADFLRAHPNIAIVIAATCAFVSLCLIAQLWVVHRKTSVPSKLVWSYYVTKEKCESSMHK